MGIEIPQNKFLILDGAMGTVLQQRGLSPQGRPELLNLTEPELLDSVYKEYIAAGSQVIYANTFGAQRLKAGQDGPQFGGGRGCGHRRGKESGGRYRDPGGAGCGPAWRAVGAYGYAVF